MDLATVCHDILIPRTHIMNVEGSNNCYCVDMARNIHFWYQTRGDK